MLNRLNKSLYWLLVLGLLVAGCSNSTSSQTTHSDISDQIPSTECNKIAFAMLQGGNYDIFTACPDGSLLVNLTNSPDNESEPVWSPDGSRIAFSADGSGSNQIYVMDATGGTTTAITAELENDMPVWLPDGEMLAFRVFDQHSLTYEWRIQNLTTLQVTTASKPFLADERYSQDWSPDGKNLVYTAMLTIPNSDLGMQQIHVRNIDGSNDIVLTADEWANFNPVWSPDGLKIAFLSGKEKVYGSYALYVMNKDGTGIQQLTEPVLNEYADYSWSPDGNEIATSSLYEASGISIITVETGETRDYLTGDGGEKSPAWQP